MNSKFRVLFVGAELAPFAKVGGLADVMGGLPKALSASGLDVSIVIPYYEQIAAQQIKVKLISKNFLISLAHGRSESIDIYQTAFPGSRVRVYLIHNTKYLGGGGIYFDRSAFAGSFKEIQRFLFFSKAVARCIESGILTADIVHANDWHTGAAVSLIKNSVYSHEIKTVFTIHNLANQGRWSSRDVEAWFGPHPFKKSGGKFNFMAEGIRNADVVTTVSESYSKEILTKKFGAGLESLLKKRAAEGRLIGILNGVDYSVWPIHKRNKTRFQRALGLASNARIPIFGLVARLTYQKGIELVIPLAREFARRREAQFVFLGRGESQSEKALLRLARDYSRHIYTRIDFDEKLAHEIYAQSDFFLMPSLFEPSGLGQLISMHYGTIPIVRATGGLKDSVDDSKTGFVFKDATQKSLRSALIRALTCYKNKLQFERMAARCTKKDFSWEKAAQKYIAAYFSIASNR